ncbi:MAG: NADH-quinone oxidoreductase subunit J, partial [Anaerolineae bacterium]|nr:NADH-quinone oxidoreductase subunit J [Anaerolineae bacterium]
AIMVLFLFVIMLLGAEKLVGSSMNLRWLTPVTVVLALIFFVTAAVGIGQGQVDNLEAAAAEPALRVAHFAPDVGLVDVYANGQMVASNVLYGGATAFTTLPAGEYNLALYTAGTQDALLASNVTLAPGDVTTVIAHGTAGTPILTAVPKDLSPVEDERAGRIVVFNGTGAPVTLIDQGDEFNPDDGRAVIADVVPGVVSESVIVPENTSLASWAVVEAADPTDVLTRLDGEVFTVERNTSQMFVVANDQTFDGTERARVVALGDEAAAGFGSPVAMGQALFTRYLLPMQMVAVLLLVAMIGAIVLTHRPTEGPAGVERRSGRRVVARPLPSAVANQIGQESNGHANGAALPVNEPVSK